MAEAASAVSPTRSTRTAINWGGVVKGVLLVTAAVVVAAVAWWAISSVVMPAVSGFLGGGATLSAGATSVTPAQTANALLSAAKLGAESLWEVVSGAYEAVAGVVGGAAVSAVQAVPLSTTVPAWLPEAGAALAKVGAVLAGVAMFPFVKRELSHVHLTQQVPVMPPSPPTSPYVGVTTQTPQPRWAERVPSKAESAVKRAPEVAPKPAASTITPRDPSYAAQVQADMASLNKELAK